jgi:hypothetical protein
MFYNFNKHKEKNPANPVSQKLKSSASLMVNKIFRQLGVNWQRGLLAIAISTGTIFSAYLIVNSFMGRPPAGHLDFIRQRFSIPGEPAPSDWAQTHASYLDSLEAAYLKDSIDQSKLLYQNADTNLLP